MKKLVLAVSAIALMCSVPATSSYADNHHKAKHHTVEEMHQHMDAKHKTKMDKMQAKHDAKMAKMKDGPKKDSMKAKHEAHVKKMNNQHEAMKAKKAEKMKKQMDKKAMKS